jgi:hypothetical protein
MNMEFIYLKHIILKKMPVFLIFGAVFLLFAACPEPNPLYGTWSDNLDNTFSFYEDGTFNARITSGGTDKRYEGNYSVLLNVLTLSCTTPPDLRVVTEWDIRGNLLYLDWANEDKVSLSMTLYKIAN